MVYLTSDLHLGHDREFIYKPRGFNSIFEMNESIISNWNNIIDNEDDIYVLGDLTLGNHENVNMIKQLKGNIHIIRGNHDTNERMLLYNNCWNIVEVCEGKFLDYKKYHFYLSHFPCMTGNLEKESLKKTTCNLFGHTHSKEKFYNDIPFMYNVAMDAHNCTPISIDNIITDMENKVKECKMFL